MWKVLIDQQKCEGEGYCVDACPVGILSLTDIGDHQKAIVSDEEEDCLGCMACPEVCPTDAITILEA